ncbi:hypothetical protein, INTERPRO suggestion: probable cysteine peptidase (plasmid) [Aromatoleum aromaticum EbN1]|uniref:Uncharacterized protein n=1 Tax=Aromatoleum aromaticum (strain DSM 19018 / LMG 30748 / EbN1) TaxID=76114 RepID=Q5NWB4_AROAE|nr:hypothetical protein, INTERPRO suggestion: probable cysteine peptidase [Aromatoleum aromaticum EbN1]
MLLSMPLYLSQDLLHRGQFLLGDLRASLPTCCLIPGRVGLLPIRLRRHFLSLELLPQRLRLQLMRLAQVVGLLHEVPAVGLGLAMHLGKFCSMALSLLAHGLIVLMPYSLEHLVVAGALGLECRHRPCQVFPQCRYLMVAGGEGGLLLPKACLQFGQAVFSSL